MQPTVCTNTRGRCGVCPVFALIFSSSFLNRCGTCDAAPPPHPYRHVNTFYAVGLNVSLRWSAGDASGLRVAATPVGCATSTAAANCSDYAIVFSPSFAWGRAGTTRTVCQADSCHLELSPHGLARSHTLTATLAGDERRGIAQAVCNVTGFGANPPQVPVPAAGEALAVSFADLGSTIYLTTYPESWEQTVAALNVAEQAERASLAKYGELGAAAGAVRAAVMWNAVYVPAEQGPVLPVDRSWDLAKQPAGDDWMYTMFQWDNHFASLMVAMDNETCAMELAISNYISTVKSTKTAEGFGSNYGAAGCVTFGPNFHHSDCFERAVRGHGCLHGATFSCPRSYGPIWCGYAVLTAVSCLAFRSKSVDRTEPPQAARTLVTLYRKFNGTFKDDAGYACLTSALSCPCLCPYPSAAHARHGQPGVRVNALF